MDRSIFFKVNIPHAIYITDLPPIKYPSLFLDIGAIFSYYGHMMIKYLSDESGLHRSVNTTSFHFGKNKNPFERINQLCKLSTPNWNMEESIFFFFAFSKNFSHYRMIHIQVRVFTLLHEYFGFCYKQQKT